MIIAITGYPGTGKTTLANKLDPGALHTDDYLGLPYELIPSRILCDIKQASDPVNTVVIEGVQVIRLLKRGWRPGLLIVLTKQYRPAKPGDASLRAQVDAAVAAYIGPCVVGKAGKEPI